MKLSNPHPHPLRACDLQEGAVLVGLRGVVAEHGAAGVRVAVGGPQHAVGAPRVRGTLHDLDELHPRGLEGRLDCREAVMEGI